MEEFSNAQRWAYLYDCAAERAATAESKIRQLEKRVCQLEQELAQWKEPKWEKRSKMAARPGGSWTSFEGPGKLHGPLSNPLGLRHPSMPLKVSQEF